jgi:hypothetical protein
MPSELRRIRGASEVGCLVATFEIKCREALRMCVLGGGADSQSLGIWIVWELYGTTDQVCMRLVVGRQRRCWQWFWVVKVLGLCNGRPYRHRLVSGPTREARELSRRQG